MAVRIEWHVQDCGKGGRESLADDVCYQLARQSSKGTFTHSLLWHCPPQLTGVSSARARWVNPKSTRGINPTSNQIPCSTHSIYVLPWGFLLVQLNNKQPWDFPPSLPGWTDRGHFGKSQSRPQLILKQGPLASGPVRCYSPNATHLCSQIAGAKIHLHPPPSMQSWCCSQHSGRETQKGLGRVRRVQVAPGVSVWVLGYSSVCIPA